MANKKGRKSGSKNIKYYDDYIKNQHNVKISHEERKQFESLVRRVNYKREKMIKEFNDQPITYGKRKLPENRLQLQLMGEELDLAIRKRSASVNAFKSRKQFLQKLENLEKVASTNYVEYRVSLYKENFVKTLREKYPEFGRMRQGIVRRINAMSAEELSKLIGSDRLFQIKEHYTIGGKLKRLQAMREKLGLPEMDMEDPDEYTENYL